MMFGDVLKREDGLSLWRCQQEGLHDKCLRLSPMWIIRDFDMV